MKSVRNFSVCLMAMLLMLFAASGHAEDETWLQLNFTGLYATSDGSYAAKHIPGCFEIYSDGLLIGTIEADESGSAYAALERGGEVRLVPIMDTIPTEIPVDAQGYAVSVAEGKMNAVPIAVRARAGLFTLQAEGNATFRLFDAQGNEALSFATNDEGEYDLPAALPAGQYTLRMEGAEEAAAVSIQPYSGAESIARIEWGDESAMALSPEEPAEEETNGTLLLYCVGEQQARATYTVFDGSATCASGALMTQREARIEGLAPGSYKVTVFLPKGVMLTGLNGYPNEQSEMAQWLVDVTAGQTSSYQIELGLVPAVITGSVSGSVMDHGGHRLANVKVTLSNENGEVAAEAVTDGEGLWHAEGLESGSYTITYDDGGKHHFVSGAVTVLAGEEQKGVAVRATNPGHVRVRVFVDANNNGVHTSNEAALPGATISLVKKVGGVEQVIASGRTASDGEVTLAAPAGKYTLRCELPKDYGYNKPGSSDLITHSKMEQSVDRVQEASVTLQQGEEILFGIGTGKMCVVKGTIWNDVNSDGLWQSKEPGVAGVRVTAEGTRNGLQYETFTDEQGRFEIRQIRNGTYEISYHVPDGYVFTYKASGQQKQRSLMTTEADRVGSNQIVFEPGDVVDEQNVGLVNEAVVEGICFLDENYNGMYDEGEQVLPGVEIELFRQSNNKRLRTVTSDQNGHFRFGNVRSDTFKLKALLPEGCTYTILGRGENGNAFAPRESRREQTVTDISVDNGDSTRVAIGAIRYGSISGVAYEDGDLSGKWERGEKIVSGLLITLLDEKGSTVKTMKTNKNGGYTFDNLTPGTYSISLTAESGMAFTAEGTGNVIRNLGGGKGASAPFELALGENMENVNAGMIWPAKVTGVAFADANDNGRFDAGERGLTGTVVSLMEEDGPVSSMKVASDGSFTFDSVMPGRYYLRYELPDNGVFSPRVSGGNQVVGEGSDGAGDWFDVSAGDTWEAPVCGGLELGVISGQAFGDSDGSGKMDGQESPMAGMSLTLTPTRADLSAMTVVTGPDGSFLFDDLRPDTYTLHVVCPDDYVLSLLPDVTLELAHGLGEQTIEVKVGMGSAWTAQQIGCVRPAAYSGEAWLDENLDGVRDAFERPAVGESILLIEQRSGNTVAEIRTDSEGRFRVDGLAPGLYTLEYQLENGACAPLEGDCTFEVLEQIMVMKDIAILEGEHASGARLGIVRETAMAGHVWLDHDGEIRMVAGVKISLRHAGETIDTALTDETGSYLFEGLLPGDYQLHAVFPEGYLAIEPDDRRLSTGEMISVMTNVLGSEGQSGDIRLEMGLDQKKLDVGSVKPGRLGDRVWLDLNANGLQDGDEGGIPGVTIELIRNGVTVATTVSDQYGYYIFKGLYPGEYVLRATAPAQIKPTVLRTDLTQIVSVLNENGESIPVSVASDGASYAADLGYVLVQKDKYPEGYGEGATQIWRAP